MNILHTVYGLAILISLVLIVMFFTPSNHQ
jgi:hypothetical protein